MTQTSWLLPLKSTAKAEWPDPELSIGREYCSLGRNKCWELRGPAQTIADRLFPKIKGFLESRNEYLNEREPIPVAIILGFYMIGRAEKKSNPTLLVTCEKKAPRRKALNVVMESGLLSTHPGFLLAESARSPLSFQRAASLALNHSKLANPERFFNIYPATLASSSKSPCGLLIQIKDSQNESIASRIATIGGLVYTEDEKLPTYYGVTVAHVFAPSLDNNTESIDIKNNDEDDIDFAFYGPYNDEEDEDEDEDFTEASSRSSVSPPPGLEPHVRDTSSLLERVFSPQSEFSQDLLACHSMSKVGRLCASSVDDGPIESLDWAMIEIDPTFQKFNEVELLYPRRIGRKQKHETKVRTCTGTSGMLTGTMSANPTLLRLPGSQAFQEVWVVRLDGELKKGDCGSWIVDTESGDLYGQIVAGHLNSGLGYIVPAYQILDDMEKNIGKKLALLQEPSIVLSPMQQSLEKSHSSREAPPMVRQSVDSGSSSYQEDWEAFPTFDLATAFDLPDNFALSQQLEKLRQRWNDSKAVTLREKLSFIGGVWNIFISGFIIGGYPEYFHIWYTAQLVYYMPIRFYTYYKRGWGYFLADLCYFVNFLTMLSIWVFPNSKQLFVGTYFLAYGNNAFAVAMWRNSMVFHSLNKVTTLFIHIMPCVTLYCIVHLLPPSLQETRFPAVWAIRNSPVGSPASYSLLTMILWSTIPYAIWQLSYHFLITVGQRKKIAAGCPNSFTWLRSSYSKAWIGQFVTSFPEYLHEPAFMLIQFMYALITMMPCPIWLWYRHASSAFLMTVFCWSIYNGATYYIDVFGKRFQNELEAMKREATKWQNSPDMMTSPLMTPSTDGADELGKTFDAVADTEVSTLSRGSSGSSLGYLRGGSLDKIS